VTAVSAPLWLQPFSLPLIPALRRQPWPHARPVPTGKAPMIIYATSETQIPQTQEKDSAAPPPPPPRSLALLPSTERWERYQALSRQCASLWCLSKYHLFTDAHSGGQSSHLRLEPMPLTPGGIRTFFIGLGIFGRVSHRKPNVWHMVGTLSVGLLLFLWFEVGL
jgi:hypothetical protein